jgi:two-component system sensor histidine kinase/response regulator
LPRRVIAAWRRVPEVRRGYIVAFASVAASTIAVLLLRDYLSRSIFILFAAPVAMAAWYAGRGPALLAMALGVVAADLVFLDRQYLIVPRDPRDIVAIGVFVAVGLLIVHLNGLVRSARADAQGYAGQLEEQALELELQAAELEHQMQEAQRISEELEAAHQSLKKSAGDQLAEAQSLARLGSWEWNITENRLDWSDEMYRLYGLEPGVEQITFERYQSLLHPADRDASREIIAESLESGKPFSFDHLVVRADGVERIFHARGKVVMNAAGQAVRMLGTGQDVTESRRAEAALRAAAEYAAKQATAESAARHLNRVFSQAPVVIAVLKGPKHTFELVNEKGLEVIGVAELLGKPVAEVLPEVAAQGFGALLDRVFTTGEPFIGREMSAMPAGEGAPRRYFNFVFQPLSEDGEVYGVLVVASEVTDLVAARLSAEAAQREAVDASRAKSDFLARMSHELRTPLAAIIGYGELLADGITGPVNEEQAKQLTRIRWSANHLLSIIDEILTLARMEAGKERVDVHNVDVPPLLESVASMAEPLAAAKGLSFELRLPKEEVTLRTDPMKLRQVLLNLISNAVKYTDTGTVALSGDRADGHVHFLVSDTGVGVAEDHLEKIFEPFWQVEQTTTRRAGGTGLGLAVTRQFVDLLGGTIDVNSTLGKGSTFRVSLPVPSEDSPSED